MTANEQDDAGSRRPGVATFESLNPKPGSQRVASLLHHWSFRESGRGTERVGHRGRHPRKAMRMPECPNKLELRLSLEP